MAPLTRLVPMEAIHASSLNGQFGSALVTGPDFDDSSDISTFWTKYSPFCHPSQPARHDDCHLSCSPTNA
ncbi:hypothetical protein E4U38_005464 [Claviceps purpurea]|nr:hypothetical protein E4U38_005464 [Claviceps purpurea]KAG6177332.1 hypothetical protein E4U27_004385 [Claviceps purpurea]KAG6184455.1 hypothetical protein E4U36_001966 [Claviceps purpurea]KAG6260708.1 hypothetical protein E4U49_004585 [Claviceps purpurea]